MTELASNCGDTHVDLTLLGLKWALTLKWNVSPSKSNLAIAEVQIKINILHGQHGVRNSG